MSEQNFKTTISNLFENANKYIQFFLFIIAIVGIYLAYNTKKKELTFSVDSVISLVDKKNTFEPNLSILYDSMLIDNLHIANCSFTNTGDLAITQKDFIENIKIELGTNAKFLRYEVKGMPQTINCNVKTNKNYITLSPDLLNPEDEIKITIYYSMSHELLRITSRIIDGKTLSINELEKKDKKNTFVLPIHPIFEKILFYIILIWNVMIFFVFVAVIVQRSNAAFKEYITGTIIIILSVLTVLFLIATQINL